MRKISAVLVALVFVASPLLAADLEALWQKYMKGDLTAAIEGAKAAVAAEPGLADAHLLLGRALVDGGQLAEGRAPLETVLALDKEKSWRTAWALTYLGRVECAAGKREAAREAFNRVVAMNATTNVTRTAMNWVRRLGLEEGMAKWKDRDSAHFVFHFAPSLDAAGYDRYVEAHERAYATIQKFFGAEPPRKIDFFVWDDAEAERLQMKLGFAQPEYPIVHAHAKQTVGHEMTHVLAYWAGHPVTESGIISEGAAVAFDQTGRDLMAGARAAAAKSTQPVTVEALWTNWRTLPEDVTYPAAGAFVRHLIEQGGRDRFLKLLSNQTIGNARSIYGDDFPKLVASFEKQLAEK